MHIEFDINSFKRNLYLNWNLLELKSGVENSSDILKFNVRIAYILSYILNI